MWRKMGWRGFWEEVGATFCSTTRTDMEMWTPILVPPALRRRAVFQDESDRFSWAPLQLPAIFLELDSCVAVCSQGPLSWGAAAGTEVQRPPSIPSATQVGGSRLQFCESVTSFPVFFFFFFFWLTFFLIWVFCNLQRFLLIQTLFGASCHVACTCVTVYFSSSSKLITCPFSFK